MENENNENSTLDELLGNPVQPNENKVDMDKDFKEGSVGRDEYTEEFLLGLGITVGDDGEAKRESSQKSNSEEDENKEKSDDAVNHAAKTKGVDINLDLDDDKYVGAFIIERDDFLRAFNLAIPVIQSTSTVAAYKGLNLIPRAESNEIDILAINGIETMTYTCRKVEKQYKMLNEVICLESTLLQKLVRVIGNHILIYRELVEDESGNKVPGNLLIRLIDGDLVLELKKVNEADTVVEGTKGENVASVDANQLNEILKTLIPIAADGFRPEDRNIAFLGDRAYYKSSKYVVKYDITTPKFISKSLESEFLRRLCTAYRGKQVSFYNIENVEARRIGIGVDNVYYTMITATPEVMEREKELLESAANKEYISADYVTFLRIVSLAADLPKSTGAITIKAEKDKLKISIESKSGNSEFTCEARVPSDLVNAVEVRLIAKPLKKLLSSITAERVNIAIEQSNIFIQNESFVAVFMNII